MKLTRLNLALLALTIGLAALVALTRPEAPAPPADEAAFGAFDPGAILEIGIARGDERLTLTRRAADAPWTLPARGDFRAEAYPVEQLLAAVANLDARDLVSESEEGAAMFGLAGAGGGAAGIDVTFTSPGNADWRFVFADAPVGGRGFLRAAGEARVYQLQNFVGLSRDPRQWIAPSVFDFTPADVVRLTIRLGDFERSVTRDDKGIWREDATGRVAPRVSLEDLVGDLDSLALVDVVQRSAEEPGATGLELELFDGQGVLLAGLALDLKPGEAGRRRVEAQHWADAGHGAWIGLVEDAAGVQVMKRIDAVLAALEKTE